MGIEKIALLRAEIEKAVFGRSDVIEQVLVALLADGHALLEGVPGTAKTLLARTLARCLDLSFSRIQFTPDLMPADVVGTNVYRQNKGEFELVKGPVFTDVLLADEINRTTPKTQSALLEAMEEHNVTIDGVTHGLPDCFFVVATQNSLDFEGTYPLPEAQLDRFLVKCIMGYPDPAEERKVISTYSVLPARATPEQLDIHPVLNSDELLGLRRHVTEMICREEICDYAVSIVEATRSQASTLLGASPRAGLHLVRAAKARAVIDGREYVIPDDVKAMAVPVLRHRLILRPEAGLEGVTPERVIEGILERVPAPK